MGSRRWAGIASGLLLGLIFVVAGLGKLHGQAEEYMILFYLPEMLLRPALINHVYTWVPHIELSLGLLLMLGIATKLVVSVCLFFIAVFIFNKIWLINEGQAQRPCGCFGSAVDSFLGYISTAQALYLDIGLLILVLVVLFCYPGNFVAFTPWFLRTGKNWKKERGIPS